MEILISFNKGIYEKNNEIFIRERSKIIINYIKNQFFLDLLPTIALLLQITTFFNENYFYYHLFLFFGFLRILHIFKITRIIEANFNLQEKYPAAATLVKLLFLIFTMAHFCCCGFYYTALI